MNGPLILVAYGLVLFGLLVLSLHRAWLVSLYKKGAAGVGNNRGCGAASREGPWPLVTVQLPVYNERFVIERLIDATCRLDYPRDLLEIQVLDDSDDETVELAGRLVRQHAARGVRIEHLRRPGRSGYKAGALAHGLRRARGEFVLILDADFLPQPDLLRRLLPPFEDQRVGMVQARWGHLNAERTWLTRAQALLLDGQFMIEHIARSTAGLFFNFNGTAGIWRVSCLRDAGGWQADTLTEDLDLSYRAQMRGWRLAYLPEVIVSGELPQSVRAFKNQQARWSQGAVQAARKLLPTLLRGDWPLRVKLAAAAHLSGHLAAPLTLALTLLVFPAVVVRLRGGQPWSLLVDLFLFIALMGPLNRYYVETLRARGQRIWPAILLYLPLVMGLGVGISVSNTRSVAAGLVRRGPAEFVRTPKRGAAPRGYRARPGWGATVVELALSAYAALAVLYALAHGLFATLPFLLLFLCGFSAVAAGSLAEARSGRGLRAPS
ncbi:MAG: glycosyltransferase family 2 protein [Gemmatimonadota bacterium]|nr:MAG: glycosyltransferase family 2 protein [Gemmatimonadota bacterium]